MPVLYPYKSLLSFAGKVFAQMGCSGEHAATAAKVLLSADLRGVDSHGISRLDGYLHLWESGRINTDPNIQIIHETPSTAVIDGDKGLGLVVAPAAMKVAIEKANHVGTGWVSVKNSNHFGIAGYHAMLALPHNMIGIALTNASATVAPTFSQERLLGTNPIAVAIPAGDEPPFVADFATTTAANGKLEKLQREGKDAPTGWIQDKTGLPTTSPFVLKNGGSMLPLGGDRERGSHKGYMLGAIVDIFSALLSGANYGPWVPPFPAYLPMPDEQPGEGIGHFLGAMRIDAFRTADQFREHMDKWIKRFRSARVADGFEKVIIPGDPEREMEAKCMSHGITLHPEVIEKLEGLATRWGIELKRE